MRKNDDKIQPDDFARFHADYYEDADLCIVADTLDEEHQAGSLVWLYWPRLIAAAKRAKSFGWFRTTPKQLAQSINDPLAGEWEARSRMFSLLAERGLIRVRQEGGVDLPSSLVDVLLVKWEEWQVQSGKERQALTVARKKMAVEGVPWTMTHLAEFRHGVTQNGGGVTESRHAQTESRHPVTTVKQSKAKERMDGPSEHPVSIIQTSPPPTPELAAACTAAGSVGINPNWWQSSIDKIRHRHPSIPDTVFAAAIDDMVTHLDGTLPDIRRAWSMLQGYTNTAVRNHQQRTQPDSQQPSQIKRRSIAEVNAANEALWSA